jgi:hypothetical protein
VDSGVESIAFTTEADRIAVVDAATAVLVQHDFTITLANERLGLLQTDYASVANIEALRPDMEEATDEIADLYMRLTVNAEERGDVRYVQIKGNFQRMGRGRAPDRLIGLYWMEQLASDIAQDIGTPYAETVSAETYAQALGNADLPTSSQGNEQVRKGLRALGIVSAVLFAVTLAAGVLQPSGSR